MNSLNVLWTYLIIITILSTAALILINHIKNRAVHLPVISIPAAGGKARLLAGLIFIGMAGPVYRMLPPVTQFQVSQEFAQLPERVVQVDLDTYASISQYSG